MNVSTQYVEYTNRLSVIETQFGIEWLEKWRKHSVRTGRWGPHPIPEQWHHLKNACDRLGSNEPVAIDEKLISTLILAGNLQMVCDSANYAECIWNRLKYPDFEKALYEIEVGAQARRCGYAIRFVLPLPSLHTRTADIAVTHVGEEIYLECKRKDAYLPSSGPSFKLQSNIVHRISDALNDCCKGTEVILLSLGQFQELQQEAVADKAIEFAKDHRNTECLNKDLSVLIVVRDQVEAGPMMGGATGVWIPAGFHAATASAVVEMREDGARKISDGVRVLSYEMDWYRLRSVIATCNSARGQLPKDSAGVIYVDLDVKHFRSREGGADQAAILAYMQAVGKAARSLFTPTENTRISAIVFTAGPIFAPTKTGIRSNIASELVINPYGYIPANFKVPYTVA